MAYAGKLVSCKTILAKIERTFKPNGSSWINEAIEDMGWAIPAIGYHGGFEMKQTPSPYLTVAHNRAKIPCEVERIIAVEMLLPDSSIINKLNPDGSTPYPLVNTETEDLCNLKGIRLPLGSDLTNYGIGVDNARTTKISPGADYYNINVEYIVTSFTDGLLRLHYIAYALDKDGLPKIIDDPDYKMALEWYCFSQMILKGYKHPELTFKEAFSMWEMYRLRAENAIKGQTIDSADRFKNTFTRAAINGEFPNDFFMNMEQQEFVDR